MTERILERWYPFPIITLITLVYNCLCYNPGMDNEQQPGQMYSPDGQAPQGQNNAADESRSATAEQSAPANQEIADIDSAVQNTPQQPNNQESLSQEEMPETTVSRQTQQAPTYAAPPTAPQQSETTGASQLESEESADTERPLIAWEAAEPAGAKVRNKQYMVAISIVALIVVGVVILLGGINFKTIISVVVVVLALVAVVVSSRQHTHLERYAVYEDGVVIGEQFYSFAQLRAFSIVSHGNAASIELEPTHRFMVRRVMYLDNGTADQVIDVLNQRLPYEERSQSVVEQLSNKIGL